jgi:hypothetical protein
MTKNLILICFFSSLIILLSCGKKKSCNIGGLNLQFKGFDSTSIDTITITSYLKNFKFDSLINSNIYILQDSLNSLIFKRDTTYFIEYKDYRAPNGGLLNASYDWKVSYGNNEFQITGIKIEEQETKCGGILSLDCWGCYSPVISCFTKGEIYYPKENYIVFEK